MTKDCRFLGQNKCSICERFGHKTEDCYSQKAKELKQKLEWKTNKGGNKKKKYMDKHKEEVNKGEEMGD
jgi:hypothetical protein